MAKEVLDDLDRRILRVLQEDSLLSYAKLAQRVSSSTASCMRRVSKLRSSGVIRANVALLDPSKVGKSLNAIVRVELERERIDLVDEFKRAIRAAPEVTQCYLVTGEADFVLFVVVEDIEHFDYFVRTKLYTNPNVRRFHSMIVLQQVKFETRVKV